MGDMNMPVPADETPLLLPEGMVTCGLCRGHGQFVQRYCDAGRMTGPCDGCRGAQFRYAATGAPAPASVRAQIATRNGLEEDRANTCYAVLVHVGPLLVPRGKEAPIYVEMDRLGWAFGPNPVLDEPRSR